MIDSRFKNKKVFLTGHTGFKGSWLSLWLHRLGAQVHGYSLPPPTTPSNYALSKVSAILAGETIGDIRDRKLIGDTLSSFHPDVIFHLAAQPLVRDSYAHPHDTFDINVMGTSAILNAVRDLKHPCAVVCITTDKCYENRDQVWSYRECDALGGHDPYSASKAAAEIIIESYRRSFFNPDQFHKHGVQLASARAGNVIGGGDWARDRIMTDLVAALMEGRPVPIRNPQAIRPWQHVLEPLSGYLALAAAMLDKPHPKWSSSWNFGPVSGTELPVGKLADYFIEEWGSGKWTDASTPGQPHEASVLRLNSEKACCELGWHPRWACREMIRRTARWYKHVLRDKASARDACEADIISFGSGPE